MAIEIVAFEALRRCGVDPDRDLVLEFLRSSPTVVDAGIFTDDLVDPSRGQVVPVGFGTDGQLVWELAVAYYLDNYEDLEIPQQLRAAAVEAPAGKTAVSEERLTEIAAYIFGQSPAN